ncbi:Crp/Fnr family transcriptional regulator [Rhizobium sp. BE258]|uniref:Crp/Fnr family transcriptional regulator n=1 Tax=Rhizobium sp. BE258 TaxID=2817722 RepID=UPI00386622CE
MVRIQGQRFTLSGGSHRAYDDGDIVFDPEARKAALLILVSGWAVSCKSLPNGTRVVLEFILPGDIIWTPSVATARETIEAISHVQFYELSGHVLARYLDSNTGQNIILSEMMRCHARMSERLANVGRRDALARTGHLLLELAARIGPDRKRPGLDGFLCPLTQSDIGDAVGLSTVHINRVLKDLRVNGLLSFRNGTVEFLNRRKLEELVEFDDSYLATQPQIIPR